MLDPDVLPGSLGPPPGAKTWHARSALGEMAMHDDEVFDLLNVFHEGGKEALASGAKEEQLHGNIEWLMAQFPEAELQEIRRANRGELGVFELKAALRDKMSMLPEDKRSGVFTDMARNIINARGKGLDPNLVDDMEGRLRQSLQHHLDSEALASGGPTYVYDGAIWPRPEELDAISRTTDIRAFPEIANMNSVNNSSWAMDEATVGLSEYVRDSGIKGFVSPKNKDDWISVHEQVHQEVMGAGKEVGQTITRDPFHDALVEAGLGMFDDSGKYVDLYHIPQSVSRNMLNMKKQMFTPSGMKHLFQSLNKLNGVLKSHLTKYFPSFYFRNLISDSGLSFISGALDPTVFPDAWASAFKYEREFSDVFLHEHPLFPTTLDIGREIERRGGFRGTRVDEMIKHAEGSQFASEYERLMKSLNKAMGRGDKPVISQVKTTLKTLLAMGMPQEYTPIVMKMSLTDLMEIPERISRTAHVMARMKKGDTFLEALRHMKKNLLDYSDLTDFEKKVMSQVRMFYTWHRKILPLTMEQMVKYPARYAMLSRLNYRPSIRRDIDHNGNTIFMPEHIRKKSGQLLGNIEDGVFMSNPGFHFSELEFIDFGSPMGAEPWELVKNFLGGNMASVQPWAKYLAEEGEGQDWFAKRKLSEMTKAEWQHEYIAKAWDAIPKTMGWETPQSGFQTIGTPGKGKAFRHQAGGRWLHLMKQPPWGRHLSEWPRLVDALWETAGFGDPDPTRGAGEQYLRWLTGIKFDPSNVQNALMAEEYFLNRLMEDRAVSDGIGQINLKYLRDEALNFEGLTGPEQSQKLETYYQNKATIDLISRIREQRRLINKGFMVPSGSGAVEGGGMIPKTSELPSDGSLGPAN